MKKSILGTLSAMIVLALSLVSCDGGSAPKASLNNTVDSISYAYGVSMAEQGLVQYLEQQGILLSTSNIEYDYQSKIASADSTQKEALKKEMAAKVDSVKKLNGPRLNEFVKGLKTAIDLKDKSPYAQGLSIGVQFSQMMIPQLNSMLFGTDSTKSVNSDQILSGLVSSLKKEQLAISAVEANTLVQGELEKAQKAEQARKDEELKVQYADSIAAGEAFMQENAKREGVVTLPSGLQYEIIRQGNGPKPADSDRVKVHYHGTLINGAVFDSSVDRGEPAVFGVTQVIPGWTEALKLMPVGSKWKLYIPYNLAYGSQDRGTIKPFSNLVFEVELLDIEK